MNRKIVLVSLSALFLAGCSGAATPEVTPSPNAKTPEVTAEPTTEPEPEPTETEVAEPTGTRQAPLAPGEARKLSEESAWTVSLVATDLDAAPEMLAANEYLTPPAEGEAFVVGTFSILVDGESLAAQGLDVTNEGVDPWMSLSIEYVTASGTSYDTTAGSGCYTANMLYDQGTVYEGGVTVTGDECISMPAAEVEGGLWRISNSMNESVWIRPM